MDIQRQTQCGFLSLESMDECNWWYLVIRKFREEVAAMIMALLLYGFTGGKVSKLYHNAGYG